MKEGKKLDLGLTGLDKLFSTEQERVESQLPKIYDIPLSEIDDFPDHPYKVKEDEDMDQLVQSIHITITADGRGEYCNACGIELLTASATVDGNAVEMQEDNGSLSAIVPLTVVNTKGFDLPQTGDNGVWMYGVIGILAMAASVAAIVIVCRRKKPAENE